MPVTQMTPERKEELKRMVDKMGEEGTPPENIVSLEHYLEDLKSRKK